MTARELAAITAAATKGVASDVAAIRHRMSQAEAAVERSDAAAFGAWLRKGVEAPGLKAISVGVGADGGFAVPKHIDDKVQEVARRVCPIRRIATVVPAFSEDFSRIVNLGGLATGWVAETDARPAGATPQVAKISPVWGEVYANAMATNRSVADLAFPVETWIAEEAGRAFGVAEGLAFLTGNGVNKPAGILTYPIANTPTFGQLKRVPSLAAGAITPDALFDLVLALRPQYRDNAKWLMNPTTLGAIRKLKDSSGAYLVQPGLNGETDWLLGYEVVEAEDMPVVAASANAIIFGDFAAGYLIADRPGLGMIRDPYTVRGSTLFYCSRRVGGALLDSNALAVMVIAAS